MHPSGSTLAEVRSRSKTSKKVPSMLHPSPHPLLRSLQTPKRGKIVSAEEAVRLIRENDTIATGGFVGIGFAEEIAVALET